MAKPVKSTVFVGAGQKLGLEIWRIENFEAHKLPEEEYGKFASGDSYLVLQTKGFVSRSGATNFQHDIFFWLGEQSTQDERGTAALKSIELDDHLGGGPTQHREVQGHESQAFLQLFPDGIQYTEGGVDSGFKKVADDKFKTRLLHLKGRHHIRVSPVAVAAASLNSGDVFLLDTGSDIFQWNGKSASRAEKAKALELLKHIRDNERGAKAKAHICDEGTEGDEFWTALGVAEAVGRPQIKSEEEGGSDVEAEQEVKTLHKLYRVSDSSGELKVEHVASPPLKYSHLDFNDAFILDIGTMVFVWIGRLATKQEKQQAMVYGQKFLEQMNRPDWVPISRIAQGTEPPLFKAQFVSWPLAKDSADRRDKVDFTKSPRTAYGKGVATQKEQQKIDVEALLTKPGGRDANQSKVDALIDDGSGILEVYRIEKFNKTIVPKDQHGIFFSGDSYVVIYTPSATRGGSPVIYFWLGRNSSADEKGAAAWLTKFAAEKVKGFATQVRITQGHEPNHFLSLFRGKFVVKHGGVDSGFKNSADHTTAEEDANSKVELFHVKGSDDKNVRAVQVACKTESLNSSDAFVLNTPEEQFIWLGGGCNDAEKRYARNIGAVLRPVGITASVISEGAEPDEFWQAFGGKGEYVSSPELQDESSVKEPRLFYGSDASGTFKLEEIFDFSQDDLMMDEVYILDVHQAVFVWIGPESTKREKDMAFSFAQEYVTKAATIDGRSADTPVVQVNAGHEPPIFTCWFLGWDHSRNGEDEYQRKLRELGKPKAKPGAATSSSSSSTEAAPEQSEAEKKEEHRFLKFVQLKSAALSAPSPRAGSTAQVSPRAPVPEPSPRTQTSSDSIVSEPKPAPTTSASTTSASSTGSAADGIKAATSSGSYYRGTSMYSGATKTSSPTLSASATGYIPVASSTSGGSFYRGASGFGRPAVNVSAPSLSASATNYVPVELSATKTEDLSKGKIYPYSVLARVPGAAPLPDDVDATKIEVYLSDEEFQKTMGCTKAQWPTLKAWQQKQKKQAAKLF